MGHGRMSNRLKTARVVMIIINMIIFLIGATLLGEGIDLLITRRFQNFIPVMEIQYKPLYNEILYIILIIPGLIIMFIGFFGCSGSITRIQCLLFSYFSSIGILLIFQTMIIMFRSKLQEEFVSAVRVFIRDKYVGPLEKNLSLRSFICDLIMYHFKCCGIESKNDFNITNKWNRTNPWWDNSMLIESKNFKYPLTCCPIDKGSILVSCGENGNDVYEIGCYKKLLDILQFNQGIIVMIGLFIGMIEIFALSFVLVISNRNQMNRIRYVMEELPPAYSSRTRINNSNLYFQI